MRSSTIGVVASILVSAFAAPLARAQQTLQHNDGTQEIASRGNSGSSLSNKLVMQRLPADQIKTAQSISQMQYILQDQDYTTSENYSLQFRTNDPARPGFFDKSAAGLIATVGPFTITLPTPGSGVISAAFVTATFGAPVILPAGVADQAVPGGDLYVGVQLTGKPSSSDILLLQASGTFKFCSGAAPPTAGEQMDATQPGYEGVAGNAGCAEEANLTAGNAVTRVDGNPSWAIATRFDQDVTQCFAFNAAAFTGQFAGTCPGGGGGTGNNPNFGYAGIFPDLSRGDAVGVRHRINGPPGTPSLLFASLGTVAPYSVFPAAGRFALAPASIFYVAAVPTVAAPPGEPATVSDAYFGPAPLPPAYSGLVVYLQCVKNLGGVYTISTMSTLKL